MIEREFESLLTAYLDGNIKDKELVELEQAIQHNPTYKTRYQEEFRLHALMRESASARRELNGLSMGKVLPSKRTYRTLLFAAFAASAACLLLATLLVITLQGRSSPEQPVIGRFIQISDSVQITNGIRTPHLLFKNSQAIREGDRIICDPGMQSLVQLTDGSLMSIEDESVIKVDRNQLNIIEIFIEKGKIFFEVTKKDPNEHKIIVRTSQVMATVLGTLFSIEAQATWTRADIFEGQVLFRQEQTGEEVLVTKEQRVEVWVGGYLKVQKLSKQGSMLGSPQMVLSPIEDMHTSESLVCNDYLLYVESGLRVTYLKFDVPPIKTIRSARLILTQFRDTGEGTLHFYEGSHNRWSEWDQNADRCPESLHEIARYDGTVGLGQTVDVDVSSLIKHPGLFTIIVTLDSDGNNDIAFASKESDIGPRLIINDTFAPHDIQAPEMDSDKSGTTTVTSSRYSVIAPTDDVFLEDGVRIDQSYLHLEGKRRISFLRFEISGQAILQESKLQLNQVMDTGSGTIRFYEGSHSDWTESNLSANLAPIPVREIAQYTGIVSKFDTIIVDITTLVAGPGVYTIIVMLDDVGKDDIAFASKESVIGPKLILKWHQRDE